LSLDPKVASIRRVVPEVSRETIDRLLRLEAFFLKWATSINLVAPSTIDDAWNRHFLDSAQLWQWRETTRSWLDLGSGSGFPALVLAVLSQDHSLSTILVESNLKKSAYLKQAISLLGLDAKVLTQRVEQLEPRFFQAEGVTVTARAFAPLARMLEWTDGFGSPSTRALLHKGRDYQSELAEARGRWTFDLIERPSLVDSASVILDITAAKRL
jgi:16S rRNA (guanine527-N7)-methyltransferase